MRKMHLFGLAAAYAFAVPEPGSRSVSDLPAFGGQQGKAHTSRTRFHWAFTGLLAVGLVVASSVWCSRAVAGGAMAVAPAPGVMAFASPGRVAEGTTIAKVVVIGNKTLSTQAILRIGGYYVGDECTTKVLNIIRDRLVKSGYFGMHNSDKPEEWVKVKAEEIGGNKLMVTITVDENEQVTTITITGSGPVKTEEVKALMTRTTVFSSTKFEHNRQSITDFYNKYGYSISFGKSAGMDAAKPGTLVVPIIVDRVGKITIHKDRVETADAGVVAQLETKSGGYFNRMAFYQKDRKNLIAGPYDDVTFSERPASPGVIDLTINLVTKQP